VVTRPEFGDGVPPASSVSDRSPGTTADVTAKGGDPSMSSTLTLEELEGHEVQMLEPRETLGVFNLANVSATNLALAFNAASFKSTANAWAGQAVIVLQG
jgi:hypothetical protein